MKSIRVISLFDNPVPGLVARESARRIGPALMDAANDADGRLRLDFSGAMGAAPSFLNEALLVAEECLQDCGHSEATVIFANLLTVLASKHHAIARAHRRTLVVTENGDWEFRKI